MPQAFIFEKSKNKNRKLLKLIQKLPTSIKNYPLYEDMLQPQKIICL